MPTISAALCGSMSNVAVPSKRKARMGHSAPECVSLEAIANLAEFTGNGWSGTSSDGILDMSLEIIGLNSGMNLPLWKLTGSWQDCGSGEGTYPGLCNPLPQVCNWNSSTSCCSAGASGYMQDLGGAVPNISFPPVTCPGCVPLIPPTSSCNTCQQPANGPSPQGGNGDSGGGSFGGGNGGGFPPRPQPCSSGGCSGNTYSAFPVRYSTGEVYLESQDIRISGYGSPWGHTRSFASRQSTSETLGNGFNWKVREWPYLIIVTSNAPATMGQVLTVIVQGRAEETLWFDRVDEAFIPRFSLPHSLVEDTTAETYRLTYPDGTIEEFDHGNGAFERRIEPGGAVTEVTAYLPDGYLIQTMERSHTTAGTTTTDRLTYAYNSASGDNLLQSVTWQRQIGSGSWENLQRANYVYYGYQESYGGEEDLKTVTTQEWDGSAWQETGTTYYRYYPWFLDSGSSSSSSSSGVVSPTVNPLNHLVKYVLEPAAYARMAADSLNPLTVSDGVLALYADHYFEYDTTRRVTKELVQGGSQTFLYSYEESAFDDAIDAWKTKTTETLPDGSQNIVYCNYAGQTLLQVYQSGSDAWAMFFRYNSQFRLTFAAAPSAITGYDEALADLLDYDSGSGTYTYLRDHQGVIQTYEIDARNDYRTRESVQEGQLGTPIQLREYEYCCCGADCGCGGSSSSSSSSSGSGCESGVWKTKREIVYPSDTNQTLTQETSYCYTFHAGTCAVREKITTLPVVSTGENGSGVAATRREVYDIYGNLTWSMDERGYITRMSYDIPTGAITQRVEDVDVSLYADAPAGWTTPSDGGLNLVTDFEHDDEGRIIQVLGPEHEIDLNGSATTIRRATWTVYDETASARTIRVGQGYATGSSPSYTYTLINPVAITITDLSGKLQEQIQATRASTSGKLDPSDTFAQASYTRWRTLQYTDCCTLASERVYHTIPTSGTGSEGTNYDETGYGTDVRKRRNRTVTPGGTITRTVIDGRGLVTSVWIGTDDNGGTATDPSGGGAMGNNMKLVTTNVFDGGSDGGDGYLTQQTQSVTASESRVTSFTYDFRGRRLTTDGEIDFFQLDTYDNLNRVVQTERYDTTDEGNLIAQSETRYDARGRVYQRIRYGVDPTTGDIGNSLVDNTWYDASGHVLKSLPAGSDLFTKRVYDSLGRVTQQFTGYDADETSYSDAGSVADDVILEQSETTYDEASNTLQSIQRQRYHNAPDNQLGALQNPASNPKARVTYAAMYPDPLGRTVATANFGTNGGSALSRPDTIPTRSDTVLVSSQVYNAAGNMSSLTDPSGMIVCMEYDAAGRETAKIMNCVGSSSSSSSASGGCEPSDDVNITVQTAYNADGHVATITAVNPVTGNQVTEYVYGTTLSDSELATSTLKRQEIYPDSVDSSDVIAFTYNRQQQVTSVTDQNGTVHSYNYDLLGRPTQDRVTTLGTGVDTAVQRIATAYEVRGMKATLTSYDNPTVGSGSVLNQSQFVYNDFGQLVTEYQAHGGSVNTSTTPSVQYGFADGSANTLRPTALVYPNGRELTYDYGTADGLSDRCSRIASIIDDDDTHLADYSYLGRQTFVAQDDTEPQLEWTLIDLTGSNDPDTGDIYSGFDRFGRVQDNRWYNYDALADVDRIQYGYDRASNRLWRKNVVAASLSKEFDELYSYDGVHRLKDMARGTLNAGKTALTSETFAQCWTLDATGNWTGFREDDNGDGTWDLVQARTANEVNEITNISESIGPSWITPAYNRAGNMTTMPKVADPITSQTCTYDAWNRLVKVAEGADTVSEYSYDGAKRRIIQKTYTSGSLTETRHLYYTEPSSWQVLEERVGSSTDAERQFVWGLRYIDDLVLRDRDTERLFAMQDANWNVIGITDNSGVVQVRCAYAAYGKPLFLSAAFVPQSSAFDWESLYCGYRYQTRTNLFVARHRDYSSTTGTWLQLDSLPRTVAANAYLYCHSSPLSTSDPFGLNPLQLFIQGLADIGAFFGSRARVQCCAPLPPPATFLTACIFAEASVLAPQMCCAGMQRKLCMQASLSFGSGLYATGTVVPGCTGLPTSFGPPQGLPYPPVQGAGSHGFTFGPCPPEGLSGRVCFTWSLGWSLFTAGGQHCYYWPVGTVTHRIGLGIGAGTGVSVEGGATYTWCTGV